jgi:hypothetical protein
MAIFILNGMKMQQDISNLFPSHLFWDIDPSRLDVKEDMDLIIPRALYATAPARFNQDISRLESLYTRNQIVDTLKNTKELISNHVCNLVAKHYRIKSFFRFSR